MTLAQDWYNNLRVTAKRKSRIWTGAASKQEQFWSGASAVPGVTRFTGARTIGQVMASQGAGPFGGLSQTAKSLSPKNLLIYGGIAGALYTGFTAAASYIGGRMGVIGRMEESLTGREDLGGLSYQEEMSRQFGSGLMQGYGPGYVENLRVTEMERRRLFEESSASYLQYAYDKAVAEQQGRYEGNIMYPTFPVQTGKVAETKYHLPQNWRIK